MAIPVLIIGKSGSGKSTSLRNCTDGSFNLIRVLNKPLPFKGKVPGWYTDDYEQVKKCLSKAPAQSIVIDDVGYLITNQFMRGHSSEGKGDQIYQFYNKVGDNFWELIQFVISNPTMQGNKIVYFMMHEEVKDSGDIVPKTIGKMLDEKVCVEGMFTIVLRCITEGSKHLFITQSANGAVSKSPIGMFENIAIDNDLKTVDTAIRNYYEMEKKEETSNE